MVENSRRVDALPSGIQYERYVGAASAPLAAGYRRREPEKTVLYAIVRDHLETFLEEPRRASVRRLLGPAAKPRSAPS